MSGIAGEINLAQKPVLDMVLKMRDAVKHRGPHIQGIFRDKSAVICQSKNCRFEEEKTSYMMEYKVEEKKFVITYDGDLINKYDLINQLGNLGHRFRTRDDKEVILYAYAQWGDKCLEKLDGTFAFAIWEAHNEKLFIARDRMGQKPFFYYNHDNRFLFASEIKGILAHPLVKSEIDINSLQEIILLGPGRTQGNGVFRNISELKPAHYGYYSKEGFETKRYWRLVDRKHTDSFEETVKKVKQMLLESIESQIDDEKEVGTFLSGGLDSSLITSVVEKEFAYDKKVLNTFSVTYKDHDKYFKATDFQPDNDDYYINIMNKNFNTNHHKIVLTNEELFFNLERAVDARGLPGMADVDSSLLLLTKKMKKHVNIGISGECADEIFGGYPWFRKEEVRNIDGFPWMQSTDYRYSFLKDDIKAQINPHEYVQSRYRETIDNTAKIEGLSPVDNRIREMTNLNINWFMQTLMDRNDRMSNYNNLEVRSPFCNYKLIEYVYSIPWEYKNYKGYEKGLLREAMKDYLPEEVLWRKKSPYPKTHNPEYMSLVKDMLQEIISNPNAPLLDFIERTKLEELISSENDPVPWYGQLMTTPQTIAYFIQINYWLDKFNIDVIV